MSVLRRSRLANRRRGMILLITILVLLALTVLGIAVIYLTGMSDEVAVNDRAGQQALYVADAGVNWGLAQVKQNFSVATSGFVMSGFPTSPAGTASPAFEYVRDGSGTIQTFPGGNQAKFAVNIGPGLRPGGVSGVQCGLVGYSDEWGTFSFEVQSAGWGPSSSMRIVDAWVTLPPTQGLCPSGKTVAGAYNGGGT